MPLIKSKSKAAFSANIAAERNAGKPLKQSLAIAYSVARRARSDGGAIRTALSVARRGKADGGEVADTNSPNLLDQARQQYPVLQNLDMGYVNSPKPNSGYLEYWPSGEQGETDRPRPSSLPPDKPGIEVYRSDTRPIDVLGDVVSHGLVNSNPKLSGYYNQFSQSLTDNQRGILQSQYEKAKQQGEMRPYPDWEKTSGLPAYFRGYAFDQWPKEEAGKYYTPEQLKMFDEMMGYLKSPKGSGMKHGGAIRTAKGMAAGGVAPVPFYARSEARNVERSGMLNSRVAGRKDDLPISVKNQSYIVPADVVSGVGQGNSLNGAHTLDRMFKSAPYEANMPHPAGGGMKMPTMGMMKGRRGFSEGGTTTDTTGNPVDVAAAGGEYLLEPEHVAQIGGGDINHGHAVLDAFVKHIRKKTIKKLQSLPGPSKN